MVVGSALLITHARDEWQQSDVECTGYINEMFALEVWEEPLLFDNTEGMNRSPLSRACLMEPFGLEVQSIRGKQ